MNGAPQSKDRSSHRRDTGETLQEGHKGDLTGGIQGSSHRVAQRGRFDRSDTRKTFLRQTLKNVFIALSRSGAKKHLIDYNYTGALFICCLLVCLFLILVGKSPVT